jgi:hypothetical protein
LLAGLATGLAVPAAAALTASDAEAQQDTSAPPATPGAETAPKKKKQAKAKAKPKAAPSPPSAQLRHSKNRSPSDDLVSARSSRIEANRQLGECLMCERTLCGGVIEYAQEPATLSNGDHLQVEGIFEMERRRDGSTFHNEMQAMKITTLPR